MLFMLLLGCLTSAGSLFTWNWHAEQLASDQHLNSESINVPDIVGECAVFVLCATMLPLGLYHLVQLSHARDRIFGALEEELEAGEDCRGSSVALEEGLEACP